MRSLILFRGAPGCGKSTYIQQHGLEPYTLSADTIRMQCSSPVLSVSGQSSISQKNDKTVWDLLFQMLELRMQYGCFTVIDATNSKTAEINRYKALCKKYRYRIYVIDMTDLPMQECKRRNAQRPALKQVPDSIIDKMYARFATQKIPGGVQVLHPDELDAVKYRLADLNAYKQVHIIGDIHGCHTALQTWFSQIGGLQDDSYYIFCGDYIDRGIENPQVLEFLFSIMDKPNVCLLEGNHERWLYRYSHNEKTPSPEFEMHTRPQLLRADVDKKKLRMLYTRLRQCAYFAYTTVSRLSDVWFVSHGGISGLADGGSLGLVTIPTGQMIHGVGLYQDMPQVMQAWGSTGANQVFGHRNIQDVPIANPQYGCYNLEGHVEQGGDLRCLTLTHGSLPQGHCTHNTVFRQNEAPASSVDSALSDAQNPAKDPDVSQLVQQLRACRDVRETQQDEISSFNFTAQAFRRGKWNSLTTLARGLFIDTNTNQILARGYEKFFRIDELKHIYTNPDGTPVHSSIDWLKQKLQFPVQAFKKENGFLGLLSYDPKHNDLLFCTKSSTGSAYTQLFKSIFVQHAFGPQDPRWQTLAQYLKDSRSTLLFEVIDPVHDPHIIEYPSTGLYLLENVFNEITFKIRPYSELVNLAHAYGFSVKELAAEFSDWQQFYAFYLKAIQPGYQYNGSYIEGFVLRDAAGFMTKLKTDYYSNWKYLRSVAASVRKQGYFTRTSELTTPEQNYFYGFLKDQYQNNPDFRSSTATYGCNIIALRQAFYKGDPHAAAL